MARLISLILALFYIVRSVQTKALLSQTFPTKMVFSDSKVLTAQPLDQSYQNIVNTPEPVPAIAPQGKRCRLLFSRCIQKRAVGAPIIDMLDVLNPVKNSPQRSPRTSIPKEDKPVKTQVWGNLFNVPLQQRKTSFLDVNEVIVKSVSK